MLNIATLLKWKTKSDEHVWEIELEGLAQRFQMTLKMRNDIEQFWYSVDSANFEVDPKTSSLFEAFGSEPKEVLKGQLGANVVNLTFHT